MTWARWWAGTSMTDAIGLGVADSESRWIGIRRHQAILVIAGLGLIGEWVTDLRARMVVGAVGLLLLSCAVPLNDGLTSGERVLIALQYRARTRWTSIEASCVGAQVRLRARGEVRFHGYELRHRGRLDLSGRDEQIAGALSQFTDSVAVSDVTQHISVHVSTRDGETTTLLALPIDLSAPAEWSANSRLAATSVGIRGSSENTWLLERWGYVRNCDGLMRVLRIRDFSGVAEKVALLGRVQFMSLNQDVVLQIDVIGGQRAHRLAARAVHRVGSDDFTTRSAGFRRTARNTRSLERLRQREMFVEEGSALLRFAAYVVVRAATIETLQSAVTSVTRQVVAAGLRCDSGGGRQARWYCDQLPGGPGW